MSELLTYKDYIAYLREESKKTRLDDLAAGILKAHEQAQQLQAENEKLKETLKKINNS